MPPSWRSTLLVGVLFAGCIGQAPKGTADIEIASFDVDRQAEGQVDYSFNVTSGFARIFDQYDIERQSMADFAFIGPSGGVHRAPEGLPGAAVQADDPEEGAWALRITIGNEGELVNAHMRVIGRH